MAITNKFIHFYTKAGFVSQYASGSYEFKNKYTIFIKDTSQIWAHGSMYGGNYTFTTDSNGSLTITHPKNVAETGNDSTTLKICTPYTLDSTKISNAWGDSTVNGDSLILSSSIEVKSDGTTYFIANSRGAQSKNGFYETSDIRKKNFGSNIEVDFDALSKLPKKYFTWKDDETETNHIGTSAQALLRMYPELVTRGEDGYYSVDYAKLSIVALAAIDVLNKRIEELEAKVK